MAECLTIQYIFQTPVLLDLQIPLEWLMYLVIFFAGGIISLLTYIGFYIIRELRKKARYQHLIQIYSNFLGDIVISESEEELLQVMQQPYVQTISRRWLNTPIGREVLIEQLVQNHKSLTGQAGNNLIWLYNYLELYRDSLAGLTSGEWHKKAASMQQLAEMQQKEYLKRLYRETNSGVYLVRAEAQMAVVKLSGFAGLRFLNVISQPVTQWQQLCLLNQLPAPNEEETRKISDWLRSANETIVEFALRLISKFQLFSFHDEVAGCLDHRSPVVRSQAIYTLRDISGESTADVLVNHFAAMDLKEQLVILSLLAETGTMAHLPFLETVILTGTAIRKRMAERSASFIRNGSQDYSRLQQDGTQGNEILNLLS